MVVAVFIGGLPESASEAFDLLNGNRIVGLLRLDQLLLHQVHERIAHGGHAERAAGLHDRRDLKGLALADQVADRRVGDQDLHGQRAALPVGPRQSDRLTVKPLS